jgi:hypothetical protein
MVNLPPHSPDLSPIEMIWSIIKRKLKEKQYKCDYDLFAAIEEMWYEILRNEIDHLVGSFRARCQVCVELRRESLNGHWRRVHQLHHSSDPCNVPPEPSFVEE